MKETGLFPDETTLIRRAQKGDADAADALVLRYQQKVYGLAFRMCDRNPDAAADMTQEAFLKVFSNLNMFRGDSAFSTWLFRIAANTCLDERRRRIRWRKIFTPWRKMAEAEGPGETDLEETPDLGKGKSPLDAVRSRQLGEAVEAAMTHLSDQQRMAFHLKAVEEMQIREIAEVMGLAEGTVKSHLFRATRTLREALKEWEP